MLPALIRRRGRSAANRSHERGVTLLLVAVAMFGIIAMAALSIDVGTLYEASAEAQRAADAAALAAARVISMSGLTGDPTNGAPSGTISWAEICGGSTSPATVGAVTVAQQNFVGGSQLPAGSILVTYSAAGGPVGSGSKDCSGAGLGFGVNPVATVKVTQSNLPTYFSRIWGRTGSSVSATATAEAFNPSKSSSYASSGMVPVQPRCVKPWVVPNYDPLHPKTSCDAASCSSFVDTTTGSITTPGILADGSGVIGETFWLVPDCHRTGGKCKLRNNTSPQPNVSGKGAVPSPPNLEYLPGQASFNSTAVPSAKTGACSDVSGRYAQAIAGCDQSTQYQCGKRLQNVVDLNENPDTSDTPNGAMCLIHQDSTNSSFNPTANGQDTLQPLWATPPSYPFQIQVGSNNPLTNAGAETDELVTTSSSIASLPIYDSSAGITFVSGTPSVTVIGFLQVFINFVDANGSLYVTVMNVSGCGNAASGTALTGTSPVPVRLITPP